MDTRAILVIALVVTVSTSPSQAQSCTEIRSRYNEAKAGLQRDIRAINSLGFEQTADGIEEWIKAGEDVHKQAYDQLISGLVSIGIENAKAGTTAWGSLTPSQANKYITELKSFGIDSTSWFDSLRQIAYTSGKPAVAQPINEALEQTGHLKDAVESLAIWQQDKARVDLLGGAVSFAGGFLVKSPEAGLTLAGWSFVTSLAWSGVGAAVVPASINQLANLSDQQLRALASVDRVIHHHVAAIQNATKQMANRKCNDQSQAVAGVRRKRAATGCPRIDEGAEGRNVMDEINAFFEATQPRMKELSEAGKRCDNAETECRYHCNETTPGDELERCYNGCIDQVLGCNGPILAEMTKITKERDTLQARKLWCCGTQYVDEWDVPYCQWFYQRYGAPQ